VVILMMSHNMKMVKGLKRIKRMKREMKVPKLHQHSCGDL
jgi:hypothetical protein